MKRFIRFLTLVRKSIIPSWKELACIVAASICIGLPLISVMWAIGWAAFKLAGQPADGNELLVGATLPFLIGVLFAAFGDLQRKWRESK